MRQKLSFKIIGIIALFSVGLFIFISADDIFSRQKDIMPLFVERAKAVTNSIEASIRDEQELKDKDRLSALIQKNMWLDPDINNININIKENEKFFTYVSNNPANVSQEVDSDNLKAFTDNIFINKEVVNGSAKNLKAVSPINISGKLFGTIEIDLDLTDINTDINETLTEEIFGYFIILLIFVLTMFLIFRLMVIKPIVAINQGIKAIKDHNFDYKIKSNSRDEIGTLAESFNLMALDLKNSKIDLESYNQKLKQQVDSQTKDLEATKNKLETINLDLENKVKARTAELEKFKTDQEELITSRTAELGQKVAELEKLNKFMINRENKMIELKKEIDKLKNNN